MRDLNPEVMVYVHTSLSCRPTHSGQVPQVSMVLDWQSMGSGTACMQHLGDTCLLFS